MKNTVIYFLILCLNLFGELSVPSETYGARTFSYDVTESSSSYTYISYAFDMGFEFVSNLDSNGENINVISEFNSYQQKWKSASYQSEVGWISDFEIKIGGAYNVLVHNDFAPSLGMAGLAKEIKSYNLLTYFNHDYYYKGFNLIMHHPERSDISTAILLGNDLINCDYIQKKDSYTNVSMISNRDITSGSWSNDFDIYITDPLMVNVWSPQVWPSEKATKRNDMTGSKHIVQINDPMPVYYHIQSSAKGNYDFSKVGLKNNSISFKAWITGRENEILTHEDYGCGFEQIGEVFSAIYINLGNFETQWAEGDEVNFCVTDEGADDKSGSLQQGKGSYVLSDKSKPVFRGFESKIKGSGAPILLGTYISEEEIVPYETNLLQNYPNPFNPITTIKYSLRSGGKVKLTVFNYSGQRVSVLENAVKEKGYHIIDFNAENLSSGVYYYTLETENRTITKKMLIIK